MAFRVAQSIAAAMADACALGLSKGAAAAKLQIYSGTKPTNLGDAIGAQLLLAEFILPEDPNLFDPAVNTAGGATATANDIDPVTAKAAAGAGTTATWFRVVDGDGTIAADGECTDTAGVGPLKLANTTIVSGIDVTIVSWTLFHPV